ncbi:MAG: segregation/condensation protein A [Clostridia bacterium]|nr:segregation/condensation protein A [Clostridia bacterium]
MEEIEIKTTEELGALSGEPSDFDAESFKVRLNTFEGPLDLLLELIKTSKIDICDIFLSQITEQYLEIVSNIGELDVEKASEFIEMASTLLEIKSRKLLPKPPVELETEDEDPEQKLIRQIEEYKLFKEASEKLRAFEDVDKFYKQPDPKAGDFRYVLPDDLSLDNLIDAFSKVMFKASMKAEVPKEKKIVKDRFTVAQKIGYIKDTLLIKKTFSFKELFEEDYSKSEIINTFLAVLELLKTQEITVKQNNTFDDIEIHKREEKA